MKKYLPAFRNFLLLNLAAGVTIWAILQGLKKITGENGLDLWFLLLLAVDYLFLLWLFIHKKPSMFFVRWISLLMFVFDYAFFASPFIRFCHPEKYNPQYLPYFILLAGFHTVLLLYVLYDKTRKWREIIFAALLALLHYASLSGLLGWKLNYFVWFEKLTEIF